MNFTPAISSDAARAIRQTMRGWRLQLKSDKSIEDLSHIFRPVIKGWVNYYCRFHPSAFRDTADHLNTSRHGGLYGNSRRYAVTVAERYTGLGRWLNASPTCFLIGGLASYLRLDNGSRMSCEVHVRFCEGLGVRSPRATHPYLPMAKGFGYLVAIIDLFSRKVLSHRLSNTMSTDFCVEALEEALARFGTPEIFRAHDRHQHGRQGRWIDNVFIERLWRPVNYEEVYLKAYSSLTEARHSLAAYFAMYNTHRPHQSLEYRTPDAAFFAALSAQARRAA